MMQRDCDVCGVSYEAKRATSKYCSATCRQRARRGGKTSESAEVVAFKAATVDPGQSASATPIEDSTTRRLRDAGALHTVAGQLAVMLARRLDGPSMDTGSSIAAVVRELNAQIRNAESEAAQDEQEAKDDGGTVTDGRFNPKVV